MTVLIRALVVLGCMLLPYTSWAASSAFEWTRQTDSGVRNWTQLDSSYDGTKLVAGVYSGYIYISDDGGETWTAKTNSGMRSWVSVTSSANGTKLAAVDQSPGYIYTSDDRGETWTEHTGPGSRQWQDIESSEDGSVIVAVAWGAGVYVSEDGGDTWDEKEVLGTKDWDAAAISADGTKLFVAPNFGGLYVSEDGGDTWDEDTVLGDQYWYGLSVSEDASVIVAGGAGSLLRVSNDSGATWRIVGAEELGYGYWSDPGISNDGTIIVLVDDGRAVDGEIGRVITSNDSGATWAENDLPAVSWSGATVSGDGTRAVVSPWGSDDHIYTADTVFAAASSGGDYARSLPRAPRVLVTDVNRSSATISVFVNERNGITGAGLTVSGEEVLLSERFTTTGSASYTRHLSQLVCGTDYTVKAYVQNGMGKTRSDSYVFSTLPCRRSSGEVSSEPHATSSPYIFTQDLFRTVEHEEVRLLQRYLHKQGYTVAESGPGSLGMESTYFGPMTERALAKLQAAVGIEPARGYFGPVTRAYVNLQR